MTSKLRFYSYNLTLFIGVTFLASCGGFNVSSPSADTSSPKSPKAGAPGSTAQHTYFTLRVINHTRKNIDMAMQDPEEEPCMRYLYPQRPQDNVELYPNTVERNYIFALNDIYVDGKRCYSFSTNLDLLYPRHDNDFESTNIKLSVVEDVFQYNLSLSRSIYVKVSNNTEVNEHNINIDIYSSDDQDITQQWLPKGLDRKRTDYGLQCGGSFNLNCWYRDDTVRDKFNMSVLPSKSRKLIFSRYPQDLPDGRYIYVYRIDGEFVISPYDRYVNDSKSENKCEIYIDNRSASNYSPSGDYRHVRHSQLLEVPPGSTENESSYIVNAAGELRVTNGKVDQINNASGHFAPATIRATFALNKLKALNFLIDENVQVDSYKNVTTRLEGARCNPVTTGTNDDDVDNIDQLE